jgi:Na+-driven multidrug efflux pump
LTILFGVAFILSSVVRATGAVVPPLVFLFIAMWLVRLPLAYFVLMPRIGADGIWWSFPAGSATSMALLIVYYRLGSWKKAHMLEHDPVPVME